MADMITVIERERAHYHGSRDIKMVDTKMVATNISRIKNATVQDLLRANKAVIKVKSCSIEISIF